jgi:phytoene desaturase
LLLGLNHTYDQLKHHNIFFSADYKQEFHDIFNMKQLPDDPTIYVANTSFSEAEDAPNGCSNLFILVNAPYLNKLAEDPKTPDYAQKIISELEERGLTGLSEHIQYQEIRSPFHFYDRYRSNKGSIYGTSSNGLLSAFLRPRNRSKKIDGLFLTGGSVHPGGGIPLVLQSAFNVQKLLNTT